MNLSQIKGDPLVIEIEVTPVNALHQIAQALGVMKKKISYSIDPLTLGCLGKIAAHLCKSDKLAFVNSDMDLLKKTVEENRDVISKMIAMAVKNDNGRYSYYCKWIIKTQFSNDALGLSFLGMRSQMGSQYFLASIKMMCGLS